jgi:hypothetical protein
MTSDLCCFCARPYERMGNNPRPLSLTGRCCDACNEIVTEARIDLLKIRAEIERVESALLHHATATLQRLAIAAICASRGPPLLAEKRRLLALLMTENDDGE